jgi:hypothetical protein
MYTCVKTPSSIPQGDGIFIYQFYLHRSWNKKKVDYATKEELELCGDYRVSWLNSLTPGLKTPIHFFYSTILGRSFCPQDSFFPRLQNSTIVVYATPSRHENIYRKKKPMSEPRIPRSIKEHWSAENIGIHSFNLHLCAGPWTSLLWKLAPQRKLYILTKPNLLRNKSGRKERMLSRQPAVMLHRESFLKIKN